MIEAFNTKTKKVFCISLTLLVLSVIGGIKYGFIAEFPFKSHLLPKFSTLTSFLTISTYATGFLLVEDKIKKLKKKEKELLMIFFLLLLFLAWYDTFWYFGNWFTEYKLRKGTFDKLKPSINQSTNPEVFNTSYLEGVTKITPGEEPRLTYNLLTKLFTSFTFVSLFSVLMIYKTL